MKLAKPCSRCKNKFTPTGKFQRICDDCVKLANEKRCKKEE